MKNKKATTKSTPKKSVKKVAKKAPVKKTIKAAFGKINIDAEEIKGALNIKCHLEGRLDLLAETVAELIMRDVKFKHIYLGAVEIIKQKLGK